MWALITQHISRVRTRLNRSGLTTTALVASLAVLDLVGGAQVAGWVSIASASTPTPTVVVTPYSRVVSGNIGTATAGLEVQVVLERDGSVVDTAPAVTTNSSGAWTATLPIHAPMAPVNSLDDEVIVTYSGVGAPTLSSSRYDVSTAWGAFGAVISSDGSTITVYCGDFSGCGSSIPVSVHYANGSTGNVSATPVGGTGLYAPYSATLSPAVTAHDAVQYTPTEVYEDGTNLTLALTAGLPGVGGSKASNYTGVRLPACFVDLADGSLSCEGLRIGATYEVQQSRHGSVVASQSLTATESLEDVGSIADTFSGLETGDTINMIVPAESGEPARTVSVVHIPPLRVDATSTVGGTAPTSISGSCQPGELEEEALILCPSVGSYEDQQPATFLSEFQDNLSGNYIDVSVSQFAGEYPANEATVPPSFTATAKLTNQGNPDTTSPVSLTVTPLAGGASQMLGGNANSPGGISVVNLAAGRYSASWKMIDAHGDTDSLTTDFMVQAASNEQPTGNNGGSSSSGNTSAPPPSSSTGGSGGGSSPAASISAAQIAALLGQQLIPSGKAAKIATLLKSGGLKMSFKALEAGTLSVQWYEIPAGAKLAKKAKAKPVLVASGQMTFSAAGTKTLRIRLTTAGRKLSKHAKSLKLTVKGMFTATGQAPVGQTVSFALRH